ncbi:thiol-disulfide oxidoreductase DCC family protein [Methylobacterium thuringiense]|uniref:thiol-disulfide oxidoreductase DCC family protein n=1 Tax=Methylobacterium thuringiense TaxID=1003091 RepID=UPI001EDEC66B|nr:DUF393 domain-containing protein [Methylobacterium thuringiense]
MSRAELQPELTVYYDGACPLCRAEIGHYQQCAGAENISFLDVGDEARPVSLGPDLDQDLARRRFHVRDPDGQLVSGAAAFARLWRALPGWRWLSPFIDIKVFGLRPLLPVAEVAYRLSLRLRPTLTRLLVRNRRRN